MGEFTGLRRVAIGGMAEIFLARRAGMSGFERLVVVKRILPEFARNQEFIRMFLNEARIAATLHHTNIVQVHSIGEEQGQVYFAMEFLHGEDLSRVLSRAGQVGIQLPLDAVLAIISSVCSGLEYAHTRLGADGQPLGIVHRDVSPHNVFICYDGGIKLLDFGIAKATNSVGKTRTGVLKGKVAYMSPEQAYSQPVDRRSDIFCIGIMLWELSTGRRLYRRRSELETLKALVDADAPRPSTVVASYPAELEAIVMKCLERDREKRWSTCDELLRALEVFAQSNALHVSPQIVTRMMRKMFTTEIDAFEIALRAGGDVVDEVIARMESTQRKSSIDDWDSDVASVIVDIGSDSGARKTPVPNIVVESQSPARSPTPTPTPTPKPQPALPSEYPIYSPPRDAFAYTPTPSATPMPYVPKRPGLLRRPGTWIGAGTLIAAAVIAAVVLPKQNARSERSAPSPEPAIVRPTESAAEPAAAPAAAPAAEPAAKPAAGTPQAPEPVEEATAPTVAEPTVPDPKPAKKDKTTNAKKDTTKVVAKKEPRSAPPKKAEVSEPKKNRAKPSQQELDALPAKKKPTASDLDSLPM